MTQEIEGMIRRWKDAIEKELGCTLEAANVLIPYIVQHAGTVITRYRVGSDGMTPYQRLKGKMASEKVLPLGEKVLYMPLRDKRERNNKLEPRFLCGIWSGISARSGEFIIITPDGQTKARTIKRLPEDQRWDKAFLDKCKGAPWDAGGLDMDSQEIEMPEAAEEENGNSRRRDSPRKSAKEIEDHTSRS